MKLLSSVAIFLSSALCAGAVYSESLITVENWKNHSAVVEVRKIYNEIQGDIESGKNTISRKDYDVNGSTCDTYPIKQKSIAVNKSGLVRKFSIVQLISHREPLVIERFYDVNGVLRFVFTKRIGSEIRIYLNSDGAVVWAVEKNSNKFTWVDYTKDDWETVPSKSSAALEEYNNTEGCPTRECDVLNKTN